MTGTHYIGPYYLEGFLYDRTLCHESLKQGKQQKMKTITTVITYLLTLGKKY